MQGGMGWGSRSWKLLDWNGGSEVSCPWTLVVKPNAQRTDWSKGINISQTLGFLER